MINLNHWSGSIYSTSTKQKLSTRSIIETELVGMYGILSQILWTIYFLDSQCYNISSSVIHLEKPSANMLATNYRTNSIKRTRHIRITYVFVADTIKSKKTSLEHDTTNTMIVNFFTNHYRVANSWQSGPRSWECEHEQYVYPTKYWRMMVDL